MDVTTFNVFWLVFNRTLSIYTTQPAAHSYFGMFKFRQLIFKRGLPSNAYDSTLPVFCNSLDLLCKVSTEHRHLFRHHYDTLLPAAPPYSDFWLLEVLSIVIWTPGFLVLLDRTLTTYTVQMFHLILDQFISH